MSDNLSYLSTPMVGNYMYETVPDRLRHLAAEDGDREAFVYYDINWKRESITRGQLLKRSLSLARVLVKDGLRRGATVGFCMSNSITMLIAHFAVVCAGGISFFMGSNMKDGSDVIETLKSMECEMFVIDTNIDDDNWNILNAIWPTSASTSSVATLKTIICHGNAPGNIPSRVSLQELMERKECGISLPDIQPEDHSVYFCTSGSSGKAKEVVYTTYSLFNCIKQSNPTVNINDKTRLFFDRTFSWLGGYPRVYLVDGATRIFVDPRLTVLGFDTNKLGDVISAESCDVVIVPGYIAVDLLNHPHLSKTFGKVKGMILTGERAPETHAKLKNAFCKDLYVFYGTTETGGACVFKGENTDDFEDGIIGKPIGGYEIKLVDESGSVVPRGVQGELCLRCTSGFLCYRNNEALTRKCLDDSHWFHTGDIAHIREDGNVVVDGRKLEMISMQTNKFFPWSVERVLSAMPGVQRAFAVGVPDVRLNEVICACVLPQDGAEITSDDVKKYCDDVFRAESTSFGITTKPMYHLVFDFLPLLATGKVDRKKIAQIAKLRLGMV